MHYKILFKLSHSDGTVIDSSLDEPFEFQIGDKQLDYCLENCIKSAKLNQLQTFLLGPEDGFGYRDESAVQTMDISKFTHLDELKVGLGVEFDIPNGDKYLGYIKNIDNNKVLVDFNHLLAGHNISFQVQVLEVLK